MVKIGIIGSGNVAVHLAVAFCGSPEISFAGLYARNPEKLPATYAGPVLGDLSELSQCDLVIIAVADDAIASVADALPFEGRIVAHTSGSRPLEDIGTKNHGASFYPLQTFSRDRRLDYRQIPVFLEAARDSDYGVLEAAASLFGECRRIDSKQRRAIHLSAVFACNFANHMYVLADRLCREHDVPFSMLRPLIRETAEKVQSMEPLQAQTGPAIRGDRKTLSAHMEMLADVRIRSLYADITQSIQYESEKL